MSAIPLTESLRMAGERLDEAVRMLEADERRYFSGAGTVGGEQLREDYIHTLIKVGERAKAVSRALKRAKDMAPFAPAS